jgi:chromosomal replication initiation ATPase DnaA
MSKLKHEVFSEVFDENSPTAIAYRQRLMKRVFKNICDIIGIPTVMAKEKNNAPPYSVARQAFIVIMREKKVKNRDIARFIHRAHSSVCHAVKSIAGLRGHYPLLDCVLDTYKKMEETAAAGKTIKQ